MTGYFVEDCLVDNSGNHKLIGRIGNDHLIGRSYANTLVYEFGYDTLIGFNSFESEIKHLIVK